MIENNKKPSVVVDVKKYTEILLREKKERIEMGDVFISVGEKLVGQILGGHKIKLPSESSNK